MGELVLERGNDYNSISVVNPGYALKLSALFGRKFSGLENLADEAKKVGLDKEEFYIPEEITFPVSQEDFLKGRVKWISVVYWPVELVACEGMISKEVARIKPVV